MKKVALFVAGLVGFIAAIATIAQLFWGWNNNRNYSSARFVNSESVVALSGEVIGSQSVIVADRIIVSGEVKVEADLYLAANRLEFQNDGALTQAGEKSITIAAVRILGGAIDYSGKDGQTPGAGGEAGGVVSVFTANLIESVIVANGGNGAPGQNGANGADGRDGRCGAGGYRGARPGDPGGNGGAGGDGGDAGSITIHQPAALVSIAPSISISAGNGGPGGVGGAGGRGGSGCVGLGGSQSSKPNGPDGRDGLTGSTPSGANYWFHKTFDPSELEGAFQEDVSAEEFIAIVQAAKRGGEGS